MRSRCMIPAEWRYFKPRGEVGARKQKEEEDEEEEEARREESEQEENEKVGKRGRRG